MELIEGRRLAAPVLDTVWLARRLLAGRAARVSLRSLSHFFGTSVDPCHRALPDARHGGDHSSRSSGSRRSAAPARSATSSSSRHRAPAACMQSAPSPSERPRVRASTASRDRNDQVLYVGRARDLRARLSSYFRSERQRPAVEAALHALERVEWNVLGSSSRRPSRRRG